MKAKLSTLLVALLALSFLSASVATATPATTDVYIRDNAADVGNEPGAGPIWTSPDIKVCHGPWLCAVSQPPIVGVTNYVFVRLNRKPQATGLVNGTVHLYFTPNGGGALFPMHFTYIGNAATNVPVAGTTVMISWVPPGPGHFCLLARWVSAADPNTFALPVPPLAATWTQLNNNIAWRNVNSIRLRLHDLARRPYTLVNPDPRPMRQALVIEQPERPFAGPGRLVIDLGRDLAERWRAAGAPGQGVKLVGETQVEVFDPKAARIDGLTLKEGEIVQAGLIFVANEEIKPTVVRIFQTDERGTDIGGVEYRINDQE